MLRLSSFRAISAESSAHESSRPDALRRVLAAAAIALATVALVGVGWALVRSLDWPLVGDASLFHYVGWRIADGAVPYRDVFDFQFPGTLLVHTVLAGAFGANDVAWRAFDLAWLAIGAVALWRATRGAGAIAAALAPITWVAWHLALGASNAGQRDFVMAVVSFCACADFAAFSEGDARRLRIVRAGLLLGFAITIKPQALVLAAAVTPWIAGGARRAGRGPWRALLIHAAAVSLAPAICAVWLASIGAWSSFTEIVGEYLIPLHTRMEHAPPLRVVGAWMSNGFVAPLAVAAAAGIALQPTRRTALEALGLAYGLAHLALQSKGWQYHFEPAAIFLCALAARGLAPLARETPRHDAMRWRRVARTVGTALALAGIARALFVLAPRIRTNVESPAAVRHVRAVVDALRADLAAVAPPHARVQVFDSGSYGIEALLRDERAQPTRITYDHPLFVDDEAPFVRALRREFLDDLARNPHAAFVVVGAREGGSGWSELRRFPELLQRLDAEYRLAFRRDAYDVLVPR